jgi:HEAT repeat protein
MNKQLRTHIYMLTGFAAVLGVMILWQIVSGTTSRKGSSGGGTAGVSNGRELVDAPDKVAAARELGRRRDRESVPYLIAYLKDPNPDIRIAMTDAIGMIGEQKAALDLMLRLENESHSGVRAAIVRALGILAKEDSIPKIVRRIDDPAPEVRLAAVEALSHWSSSNAILGIAQASSDTNPAVRTAAAKSLSNLGPSAIQPMLEVMDDGAEDAKALRIRIIAGVGSDESTKVLVALLRRYATQFPPVDTPLRKAVLDSLASKGEPAAVALLPIVSEPGNLALKSAAANLFGRLKSRAGIAAVKDRLLSWKAMTSAVEWRMWTDMLKTADSPEARDALAALQAHYATIADRLPETPQAPKRDRIAARKPTDSSGYTGELSLLLKRPAAGTGKRGLNLDLELTADSGAWERVWSCNSMNRAIHEGLVLEVKTTPDAFDLHIGHMINDDPWVSGGFADLRLKLKRPVGGSGPVEGSYEGTYRGDQVSGAVIGEERPRRPVVVKDFVPLHPDEHPRLLFRQHELAAVRKRAATPFGRAYQEACSRSSDPLNHAMLHAITGDPSFAESARRIVESYGDSEGLCSMEGGFGSGGFGHRLVRVALTYDLCYDAWPETFRKQLQESLRTLLPVLQKYIGITGANYHPCCNYYGPGRGAPAIVALALWGEEGPKPQPPPDPFSKPTPLPPATDYTPSQDTPVVELVPGKMPERWLFAGPAPYPIPPMAEDALLRMSPFRPQPGTARKVLGVVTDTVGTNESTKAVETVLSFTELPKQMMAKGVIDFASQKPPQGESAFLVSTVLKVVGEQTVSIVMDGASSVWVNGNKIGNDGCYLLRPGLYPVTAVCTLIGDATTAAPRFVSPDSPEMASKRAEHDFRMAMWKADCEDWERCGGADPFWMRRASIGYYHMYAHYRVGIGDGGFQAETGSYADIAGWFPLVYAGMATRVFGRLPSPHNDVTHMVPRRMMQVYFPADGGAPFAQKLNSCHGLRPEHCAAVFPALPEQYRAPLLWGWNRVTGASGSDSLATAARATRDLWNTSLGGVLTFLNYPLDLTPAEPAGTMPLTWEARTFGFYCFRNGWEGKDEFIAQVFLKAFNIGGWNDPNAGAFRLFGLGREWVTGNQGKAGIRQFEPVVVLLPEWVAGTGTDPKKMKEDKKALAYGHILEASKKKPEQPKAVFNQNALSHLMYYKPEPDGSAVLSMDYRDVYSAAQKDAPPSGVTGMRSIGFDYSGKSGAPFLMGLADKIEGNVDKVWLWPLPDGCLANTTVKDNTFVVRQGDATMKGTFLSPPNVKLEATSDSIVHLGARLFDKTLDRIKAKGDGSFLVVITIQRGDAPAVAMQGAGMNARATIGKQTVRFDGQKIVLTPTP